jgi:CheY-like chemotaxis protein
MGLIAVTAASGKEAMASITSEPPDVILLDLMMPEMSGFEVLYRLLTGDPRTRDIPVIVVSASGIDRQKMLKLPGISEVIVKASFSVADVERAVMNALNSPRG